MGILTILGILLVLIVAIFMPLIGIPILVITIMGIIVFKIIKGGAKLTYKGIKSATSRPPPRTTGEQSERFCINCGTRLLRIPGEVGFWCPNCKSWFE